LEFPTIKVIEHGHLKKCNKNINKCPALQQSPPDYNKIDIFKCSWRMPLMDGVDL
jgi:hypothetical protein